MNGTRSQFRSELAIIPSVAYFIAVLAFALAQIALLVLVPRYCAAKDVPPMPWLAVISIVGGVVLTIIVLMVGYVNADSKRRGMNSLLWTLLVIFIPKALGFIAYFLLRKPLVTQCPNCGISMAGDFRYCSKCGYAVQPACSNCGRAISRDYIVCPYCGKQVGTQPSNPQ